MGWLLLLSGVAINIAGVIAIKFGQHLDQQIFSYMGYLFYFAGFVVISLSFKHLEVSIAYAIWSGLGSLSVLAFGIIFFGEGFSPNKLSFSTLILVGVMGISLTT